MSHALPILVFNKLVIDDQNLTSDILNTEIINVSEITGYSVHSVWTGTPVGKVVLSGSNDGVNFVPIDVIDTEAEAGQHLANVMDILYIFVQVTYLFTAGSGTLTVRITSKRN